MYVKLQQIYGEKGEHFLLRDNSLIYIQPGIKESCNGYYEKMKSNFYWAYPISIALRFVSLIYMDCIFGVSMTDSFEY